MLDNIAHAYPMETFKLGQVFNKTTNSYKFTWFLAILTLINKEQGRDEFSFDEIFAEMVVISWQPVCFYKLSLGKSDKMSNIISYLIKSESLTDDSSLVEVRKGIISSNKALKYINFLKLNVPIRFLTPWLHRKVNKESVVATKEFADESQCGNFPTPYTFCNKNTAIKLNKSWKYFILNNLYVIQSFTNYKFVQYLQTRNPNTPNIINKLAIPTNRNLGKAKNFWSKVKQQIKLFDIYSGQTIEENFSIDHFIPWSFIVHDLVWNLVPTSKSINSSKSNILPNIDIYLPRLSKLHYHSIEALIDEPKLLEDYSTCFQEKPEELIHMGIKRFEDKFRDVMLPLEQIAKNQGFRTGWIYK